MSKTTMQEVVSEILNKWNLLDAFEKARGGAFHLKIKNPPYIDLVIEKVDSNQISVAHYGVQNGDAMRDPEVVFRLPDWIPLFIQQDYMGVYRETHDENGNPIPYEMASLKSFCATWAENLKAQKFTTRGTAKSSTHGHLLDGPQRVESEGDMSAKTYVAVRTPDGVQVDVISNDKVLPLYHVVHHSPSGLEWSYAGSGPADLALSILADHFGEKPSRQEIYYGRCQCWAPHQAFKFAFIATAPQEGFELTTAQITTWLKENGYDKLPPAPDGHLESDYEDRSGDGE